jgi:hypothetical protein
MFGTTLVIFLSFVLHACFNFFVVSLNVNVTFNDNCRFVFGCPQGRCGKCHAQPIFKGLGINNLSQLHALRKYDQPALQIIASAIGAPRIRGSTSRLSQKLQSRLYRALSLCLLRFGE